MNQNGARMLGLLALLLAEPARAQAPVAGSSTISATVVSAQSVAVAQDLAAGNISRGSTWTVAATDKGASKLTISGEPHVVIAVTYEAPAFLKGQEEVMLPFTIDARAGTADDARRATPLAGGGSVTLSEWGMAFVYLGCTIRAGESQPAGTYRGTLSFTVEHY